MSNFGSDINDDDNPFRAPTSVEVAQPVELADGDSEEIRNAHLKHEASLKGIGSLYVLGGIISVFAGLAMVFAFSSMGPPNGPGGGGEMTLWYSVAIVSLMVVVGAFQFMVGLGLRKVQPWTKIPATILAVFGLFSLSVASLISIYVLYLLHSQKGKVVLSESYQNVIAQTPHIKYKTSIIVKIFVGLLVGLIAFAIVAAMVSNQ